MSDLEPASPVLVANSNRATRSTAPHGTARTNVLHVIAPADIGGAESVVRLLAGSQSSLGARVAVAAIVQAQGEAPNFFSALDAASIETHRIRVGTREYGRERRAVAALCAELAPDIVHSHGYRADVVDGLHMRSRLPVVTTVHGFTGGNLRNRVYEWLQCRAYGRFDAVVAVSEILRRQIAQRIGSERVYLAKNAYAREPGFMARMPARAALGLRDRDFVVGWVGRLSTEKGADVLLEALARTETPPEARAIFLGEGPLSASLRERGSSLGLDQRIRWEGAVPNAARMLAAFDVLVLSSRTEGTPIVLLEAMAAGTPIVATRVGGVPDVLSHDTALLVSPEAPMELASAIREVFFDRGAASERARAAKLRLDRENDVMSWTQKYETIYRQARERAAQRLS